MVILRASWRKQMFVWRVDVNVEKQVHVKPEAAEDSDDPGGFE